MSMSGRLSMDSNGPGTWNYASVPSHSSYAPDGSLNTPNHGRRSSIYRAQNSTLFNAFEEHGDGVALGDLPEEDESEDDDLRQNKREGAARTSGAGSQGRSLIGKRNEGAGGSIHPAYGDR